VSTPVIGREGLLRLVEWAERLRGRGWGEGGASWPARASSLDGSAEEGPGEGIVGVVSGGEPERGSEVVEHALGAVGGGGCAGGSGVDRG